MIKPLDKSIRVLSIDTSSSRGGVALMRRAEVVAELRLLSQETHSGRLLNSIEFLLSMARWNVGDLQLIAVGIGPGSFTGIRIGVSTALGLAQTLSCPMAAVSGLEALAYESAFVKGRIGIVMDAQRSQVYYAEYLAGANGKLRPIQKPGVWFPKDLDRALGQRRLYVTGDGAERYWRELGISESGLRRFIKRDLFLAPGIARLALRRKRSWRRGEFLTAEPLYIRPPDALRKSGRTR
jgi:tRNA threonylcarbamoyladenosine biosynthesis protein TsaB